MAICLAATIQMELGSTRALACFDRRLAGRSGCVAQPLHSDLSDRACVVGEGADHGTRGRVRSPLRLNRYGSANWLLITVVTLLHVMLVCAGQAAESSAPSWEETLAQRRNWWSLQPVKKFPIPEVGDSSWSQHPVDRFILSRLEAANLKPSEDADKHTLIRRLTLVLTGLPPTPEQTRAFVNNTSPSAYEELVDRLLASPHFGERWARHWLDVVRFSETHGNEWNYEVHHAWRYRDYLIRAFNQDLPFDQFVREHIAGDLLPQPRWNREEHFNESVIGTAFYRFGEVNHDDCIGLRQIGYDLADNQIDTLTKAFQATTVACARCHDHKIDAVSMKDYYALLGILRSSRQVSHTIDAPEANTATIQELTGLKHQIRREIGNLWMQDAGDVHRYLMAAQASVSSHGQAPAKELSAAFPLTSAKSQVAILDPARLENWIKVLTNRISALEEPLSVWRALHPTNQNDGESFRDRWNEVGGKFARAEKEHADFNRTNFAAFTDFRTGGFSPWHVGGQGLPSGQARSGDFTLHADGDAAVEMVLPAGAYTHLLSQRLNGTLRSPLLTNGMAKISFQLMGRRSSALRLVSNNCQLNYQNYRALTNTAFQWVTFSPPPDAESVRVYAELMTMFDNPKFPDQLSALGGDKANYKLPWEKAAEDPRSWFGITRVVIHATDAPPKPELTHLTSLWFEPDPASDEGVANRYRQRILEAVDRWRNEVATDDDAVWLDFLVKNGLIRNRVGESPRLEKLLAEYRNVERRLTLPRVVPGLADFGRGFDQPMLVRGDCTKPADAVPRGYLEVLKANFSALNEPTPSPLPGEEPTAGASSEAPLLGGAGGRFTDHAKLSVEKLAAQKSGKTDLPVGLDAKQRVPATKEVLPAHTNQELVRDAVERVPTQFSGEGSGRLQLAERIADSKNPLTARVMVNRVWKHLFGEGLVRTVDDFGQLGDKPSHPELLDYLAGQFMREDWSVKRLIRSIVLARTFQLSARPTLATREIDPQNRLLQHYPARRMEAEAIRDCILAVSGRLNPAMHGLSVQPYREKENADRRLFAGPLDGLGRRSVYVKVNLMETPKFLSAFNIAGGKMCQGRRDTANVPAQSLALLNDPFVLQQAQLWSSQLIGRSEDSVGARIEHMFEAALGRAATLSEKNRFTEAAERLAELRGLATEEILRSPEIWKDLAHAVFNLKEFIFIP
ncbi:MAG: DUF1553 domain-containing protein [Verrucomicrobia bacterium]|nr:DUF1553 domain-containing protein [Verrucomicrobiota bacterium]